MTAEIRQLETTPGPGRMATPQLRTLVVCDIADSTALVERMGDQTAAGIIRKHDRLARALVERHQGREIDKTDGFLLLFDRPIQAAAFALDYQRGLKHMSAAEGVVVRARVGIHMGDVVIWENSPEDVARGAKPIEVEGLVKPIAARLAQLARPQQTLMSFAAAGIAHRAEGELGRDAAARVHWKDHGRYRFKGLPEPLEVIEVGEDDIAPLHAPKSVRTAKKILPWWRRPLTLAAEAAVLAIGIGVGAWMVLQSPPTLAFGARDWVVVGNVQNHTNQGQLGVPLDAAFKLGLEQSQYVNVIPDMQVDGALKRMEKPVNTPVNRVVGSDIAMREGARALILPSLAQVGGRIQISAEVIDPHTGVTVYSDSAQADSEDQILPATDKLLKTLRGKLGESLASIQKTSLPLAQITTSNLDALRAFAQGDRARASGDIAGAELLYQQALKLDPEFAMAWTHLATLQAIYLGQSQQARASLQMAERYKARLSVRERLTMDGTASFYEDAQRSMADWQSLIQLYPDDVSAQQNLGMQLQLFQHKLADAVPHFEAVTRSRNPRRGMSWFNLAAIASSLGHAKQADQYVAEGRKLGALAPHFEDVAPALAQRDYAAVSARLESAAAKKLPLPMEASRQIQYAAIAVDRGDDAQALKYLAVAAHDVSHTSAHGVQARVALAQAALEFVGGANGGKAQLVAVVDQAVERVQNGSMGFTDAPVLNLAIAAMLAARHGEGDLARKALDASQALALDHGYYDRAALWRSADCEARFVNLPKARIACLTKLVDGREYFQTHVALALAYQAAGNADKAREQVAWMQRHRGQATSELDNEPCLIPNLLDLRNLSKSISPATRAGEPERSVAS